MAQGVPGRLKHRIFLTFGSTEVVSRQPYAPAAFTPGEIPGTHFQELSRPQGTWFLRGEPQKKIPSDTTGNRSRDRSNTLPRAPYIYIYIYIYTTQYKLKRVCFAVISVSRCRKSLSEYVYQKYVKINNIYKMGETLCSLALNLRRIFT